jgi:hypothetical protein
MPVSNLAACQKGVYYVGIRCVMLYNNLSTNSKQVKLPLKGFLMTQFCSVEKIILVENDRLANT